MRRTLMLGVATIIAAVGAYGLVEGKPHANACGGSSYNAGGGNGSELGDPGNSGLHNNAGNVGNSQSAAALADVGGEDNVNWGSINSASHKNKP